MTNAYVAYPTGRQMSVGTLHAQVSSQIAAGAAQTVRARNQTGKTITLTGATGWVTTSNNQAGTQLDITNAVPTTFLTAPMNMQTTGAIVAAGGINPANATLANGAEALFVFTNAAGGGATAMTDAQGVLYYRVDFISN